MLVVALSLIPWLLLPAATFAHPIPLVAPAQPLTSAQAASIKSLYIDHNHTAQASVLVSCTNCSSDFDPSASASARELELSLDFAIVPGQEPCSSNLSLNSVPLSLNAPWAFEPNFARGSAYLNASGHDLVVDWYKSCIDGQGAPQDSDPAQVLTLAVHSIDGKPISVSSLPGFTLSFKDGNPVQLLRLSSPPVQPGDIDASWANPSSEQRIQLPKEVEDAIKDSALKDRLRELQFLEAQLAELQKLIKDKKHSIAASLVQDAKDDVDQCDGFLCVAKAIIHHLHKGAKFIYQKLHSGAFEDHNTSPLSQGHQFPAMIVPSGEKNTSRVSLTSSLPAYPEKCHCKDEKKGPYLQLKDEPEDDGFEPATNSFAQDIKPSLIWIIVQGFFVITGLALLFRFCRRCCTSPRKKRDRAARREQRRTEREYRCASRRQAFWDWIKGRKRGRPGRRPGDFEEKSALVGQQEAILDEHMEDEIRQLKIHEELRQFQNTRDAVTDMIRAAEEGRSAAAPPYNSNPFVDSPYAHPSIPRPSYPQTNPWANPRPFTRPIHIPPPSGHVLALDSPTSSNDMPFSPVSRTTSLPSYRSKPPSYKSGTSTDGYSDSEAASTDGEWAQSASDESSIPDLSPRPSGETIRTFV